jgi:hypothetical protein
MKRVRMTAIATSALTLLGGAAAAQVSCGSYVVVAGDNLRYIARAVYGDADLYRVIYEANTDKIGAKADHIEIGMTLTLPCGPELAAASKAEAAEPVAVVAAGTAATDAGQASGTAAPQMTLRIVTGNGYKPFADETLPGGGMFTQLVEMAIFRADPSIPYNLTFISDWQAHIDALLPSLAYDLSFPWIRPECEAPETLSAGDISRCENFAFSAPFYEIVDGYFVTRESGLAAATKYAEFEGKRICRPEGYTTGVLDAVGLMAPKVEVIRLNSATDCFKALVAGEVDLVSIDAEVGDTAIAELGVVAKIEQNPHLSTLLSLHVIAHKSNQRAVDMLAKLDEGVVEMYESGEWYEIVSTALTRTDQQQ